MADFDPGEVTYRFLDPKHEFGGLPDSPSFERMIEISNSVWGETDAGGDTEFFEKVFMDPRAMTYVAEHNGQIVGYVNAVPAELVPDNFVEADSEKIGNKSCYEHEINVDEEYRGTGIGRKLLSLALNEARHRGYENLSCHSDEDPSVVGHMRSRYNPRVIGKYNWSETPGEELNFWLDVIDVDPSHARGVLPSESLVLYRK